MLSVLACRVRSYIIHETAFTCVPFKITFMAGFTHLGFHKSKNNTGVLQSTLVSYNDTSIGFFQLLRYVLQVTISKCVFLLCENNLSFVHCEVDAHITTCYFTVKGKTSDNLE